MSMAIKPFKFMSEVKAEVKRVVWPTGNATYRMTTMVLIMVTFMSIYLLMVDVALSRIVKFVLELGN